MKYMPNLPRMRTIRQYVSECKTADHGTKITEHLIRILIADGELSFSKAGRNFLLNADAADSYFANGHKKSRDGSDNNKIRPLQ
jgi:hypothetical protein